MHKLCIIQGSGGELVNCTASHEHLVLPPQFSNQWQVTVIRFSFFICGSRKTGNTTKQCYLTTALRHNKSKMFKENAAELRTLFRLSKVWKKSEQLSKLDYEIKYWTYSVWHRRARLKGSEYSESGYPVREEKGGWEHLEMWRTLKCEPISRGQCKRRCNEALTAQDLKKGS